MGETKTKQATILVADDSPTIRLMLGNILQKEYKLLYAENGVSAIEQAFADQPDLIICDIEMPQMDGYQVCRLLKNDPYTSSIPIIILTSKESAGAVYWGYQTGADLYLLKNFQPAELKTEIKKLLATRTQDKPKEKKKGIKIDYWHIMAKLNQLLDQQLFEATLINEINRISISLTTLSETIRDLLEIIEKAIENYLCGLVLISDKRSITLGVKVNRTPPQQILERFQFSLLEDLANLMNEDISDYEINAELMEKRRAAPKDKAYDKFEPSHLYAVPLRVREKTFGALSIYHPQMAGISSQNKRLLENLTPHISTAISTILMYTKIKNLSVIDELTQLYNRRHLMDHYKIEFARADRNNTELSIMMLDLDNFKNVNDNYGHLSGDLILKKIAGLISQTIRKVDIPGRYGGEEFLIILPGSNLEVALKVAERLRSKVEKTGFRTIAGDILPITISIGVTALEELENRSNDLELIKMADTRLYSAKKSGKNMVVGE